MGRKNSFNVQKVMWLVYELQLPHEHIGAGGRFGGLDTPEFIAMNPHQRVPVIDDNEKTIWESHTILRYLAARYGERQFWSDDAYERSRFERWMDWSQTTLQPDLLNGVFWRLYRTPEPQRDVKAILKYVERCARHFSLLDGMLSNQPYLAGEAFTLADIPAGTSLYRYFELQIERPDVPHVRAWYERLQERPAYREGVMIPFDDLRGRLDF